MLSCANDLLKCSGRRQSTCCFANVTSVTKNLFQVYLVTEHFAFETVHTRRGHNDAPKGATVGQNFNSDYL